MPSGRWAGSPAGSSPTAAKPSGPTRWPSGSGASTPPPNNSAPPGRRCARPSPATASACRLVTRKPSVSGSSPPPASAAGSQPPLDPVFVALNPGVLPARERSPAELFQWVRREEQYAILGVELYSESHARRSTTRAWAIIRRADRSHRLAGQRASRSERRHADRADRPGRSPAAPAAGDGGRCSLTFICPTGPTASSGSTQARLGYESLKRRSEVSI